MIKKKYVETLLTLMFIVVTGILFCCDHRTDAEDLILQPENVIESEQSELDAVKEVEDSETASESEQTEIYVYVCGQVIHPDVYEFCSGSRLYEAIEAAGGVSDIADLNRLNLAELLSDGQKVYVPAQGESVVETESTKDNTPDGRININTATVDQLQTLPGIGESKANAIVAYRDTHGRFSSIEDIRQIPGIKDGVYNQIQALIRVD